MAAYDQCRRPIYRTVEGAGCNGADSCSVDGHRAPLEQDLGADQAHRQPDARDGAVPRRSSSPATLLDTLRPRRKALCRSVCARPSAPPCQALTSSAKSRGPDGAPDDDALGQVRDAGPRRDLRDRGVGDRLHRRRRPRVHAAAADAGIGRHGHEHEEVLVTGRGHGRIGRRGPADVERGRVRAPGGAARGWRRSSRSQSEVKNREWWASCGSAPAHAEHHQHGAGAGVPPAPRPLRVASAARPAAAAVSTWCRSAAPTTTSAATARARPPASR